MFLICWTTPPKHYPPVIQNRKQPLDKFETGQRLSTSKNRWTWSHVSAYSQYSLAGSSAYSQYSPAGSSAYSQYSPAGSSAYSQYLPATQKQNTYIISVSHTANYHATCHYTVHLSVHMLHRTWSKVDDKCTKCGRTFINTLKESMPFTAAVL
jgi:hypothetical protein